MKRTKEKFLHIGIYKKLLLMFLGVMLVILSVNISFYYQGKKLLKNEISASVSKQNEMVVAYLEDEREKIQVMQSEFVDSDDVISLILASQKGDEDQKTVILEKIRSALLSMWRGSRLMEEVSVVIPFCNLEINTGTNGEIQTDMMEIIDRYEQEMNSTSFFYQDRPVIVSELKGGMYFVIAELSQSAVVTYISNKVQGYETVGAYALYDTGSGVFLGKGLSDEKEALLIKAMEHGVRNRTCREQDYLVHVADIERSSYVSISYIPERDVYSKLNVYQWIFMLLLSIIFIGGVAFLRKSFSMIHRPIHVLMDGLGEVTRGNLDETISYENSDEFSYIYDSFNHMTQRLKNLIDKNYRQEILLQKAELKQLQTQISPHFLYNSFITLSNRINAEDYEFASEFSRQLGQYFMFITRSGREYIPLEEELEHARVYARIQYTRFRNRFCMQLDDLDPSYGQIQVPRMIIQPIFENVFKYGVDQSCENIFLHMGYRFGEDWMEIIIENSGKEISDDELESMKARLEETEGEIHGMANIHQRLQLVYNGRGGISLFQGERGGLRVAVRILLKISGEEKENV